MISQSIRYRRFHIYIDEEYPCVRLRMGCNSGDFAFTMPCFVPGCLGHGREPWGCRISAAESSYISTVYAFPMTPSLISSFLSFIVRAKSVHFFNISLSLFFRSVENACKSIQCTRAGRAAFLRGRPPASRKFGFERQYAAIGESLRERLACHFARHTVASRQQHVRRWLHGRYIVHIL